MRTRDASWKFGHLLPRHVHGFGQNTRNLGDLSIVRSSVGRAYYLALPISQQLAHHPASCFIGAMTSDTIGRIKMTFQIIC
jgi:hypothetical protein